MDLTKITIALFTILMIANPVLNANTDINPIRLIKPGEIIPSQNLIEVSGDFDATLISGADYLKQMQADITDDNAGNGINGVNESPDDPDDGGWDWRVTSPPAPFYHTTSTSSKNLYGATGLGLYYAYLETGDASYFTALTDAANFMKDDAGIRSGNDLVFLMLYNDLPGITGTAYKDSARAKYDARIATYVTAQAFAEYIRDVRGVTQGYANGIIAWDIGIWVRAAVMLDARYAGNGYDTDADNMAEVIYQDSYMDNPGLFDIVDDAGWDPTYTDVNFYWYALGITGLIDAFYNANVHTDELPGLVAILLQCQFSGGGISYSYGANTNDEDWQSTAYAMMSLGNMDQTTYQADINRMSYWLSITQDISGGWKYASGNHYPEVGGECTSGLYFSTNDITDVLVDASFTGQADVDLYNLANGTSYIWGYDAFATIQDGIDGVTGSTVNVLAGTYREQLYIDKNIDLVGSGSGSCLLEAPDAINRSTYSITQWTGSTRTIDAIIGVYGTSTVNISGFTVDGRNTGPADFYGVHFFNTGGSFTNCVIDNVTYPAGPGTQSVVSFVATHSLGETFTIDVSNNTIPVFQKGGIVLMGPGCTFTVDSNSVSGVISSSIAGNCIQLSYGATGSTSGNYAEGTAYTGSDWASTGILLFESGNISMVGDEVYNCESGVNFSDWGWIHDHPSPVNLSFTNLNLHENEWTLGAQLSRDDCDPTITITGCDILNSTGDGIDIWGTGVDPWGGSYYTGWNNGDLDVTITNCDIENSALDGIWTGDMSGNSNNVSFTVFNCDFIGNAGSAINNTFSQTIDATESYWNSVTGPIPGARSGSVRTVAAMPRPFGIDLPETYTPVKTQSTANRSTGETVYGPIDYDPWCSDTTHTICTLTYPVSEVWVDDDWAGSNEGDIVGGHIFGYDAFATIQDGIDGTTGSTVNVMNGYYGANPTTGRCAYITTDGLNLIGESESGTIIDGSIGGVGSSGSYWPKGIHVQANNVTIENFTVDGFTGDMISSGGYGVLHRDYAHDTPGEGYIFYSGCTVNNVTVQNCYSVIYALCFTNLTVSYCNVINNYSDGMFIARGCDNATIHNNTVTNSGDHGIWVGKCWMSLDPSHNATIYNNDVNGAREGGISFVGSNVADIYGNTITNAAGEGWSVGALSLKDGPTNVNAHDNTIYNNSGTWSGYSGCGNGVGIDGGASAITLYHNNIYGNSGFNVDNGSARLSTGSWDKRLIEDDIPLNSEHMTTINPITSSRELIMAEENYWGTIVYASIAAQIQGSVDFDPWCTDTTHTNCTLTYPVSEVWVDDDWAGSNEGDIVSGHIFGYDAFATIQDGIDGTTGSTVNVAAGLYVEQVTIDKSLDLLGAGEFVTTIQAPLTRTGTVTEGGVTWDYIVAAYPSSGTIDVKIDGFTVNANNEDATNTSNQNFAGVFFRDIGDGTDDGIFSCTINNFGSYGAIWSSTYNTWMGNYGVVVYGTSDLNIDDNDIGDYTVSGVSAKGASVDVTVNGNNFDGTDSDYAGLFLRDGTGTVTGNTISNHDGVGTNIGIYLYEAASGVSISGANIISSNFIGIFLAGTDGATIEGNTFTNNLDKSFVIQQDSDSNVVRDNTITMVTGNISSGIYIGSNSGGNVIGGNSADDGNDITLPTDGAGMRYCIHLAAADTDDITIKNNSINGGMRGVQFDGGPGHSGTNTISDNTIAGSAFGGIMSYCFGDFIIEGNTVSGTDRPMEFWQAGNGDIAINGNKIVSSNFDGINAGSYSSMTIYGNSFEQLVGGLCVYNRQTSTVINASGNWWSTTVSSEVASKVSSHVDYTPWLGGGTDTNPGFQGDFSELWVDDDSPQTGTVACVQEGINLVFGSTVNVVAGIYNETVTIDKTLTLLGAGATQSFLTGGIAFTAGVSDVTVQHVNVTGVAASNSILRSLGTNTNLTLDNCVIDGEGTAGRFGYAGGSLEGDVTITNNEFKNVANWSLLDSRSGSGGDGSAMGTITFADNYIHECDGSIVFRGLSTDRTDVANVYGNTWENIGDNYATPSQHWAAFEMNRTVNFNFYNNTIDGVALGQWGEGQGLQIWDIDNLDVHDNDFLNCYQGIWVYGGSIFSVPGGSIYHNDLIGSTDYAIAVDATCIGTDTLDAEENYWGTIVYALIAAQVQGAVDFDPWCTDTTHTICTLTYPVSEVWVDDDWAGSNEGDIVGGHIFGYDAFATIQDGIDGTTGSTVNVAAGTYYENVVVDKSLTLYGAKAGVDPRSGAWAGDITTINPGTGGYGINIQASDVIVNGFEVTGGMYGIYIGYVNASNVDILYNDLHDNDKYGLQAIGIGSDISFINVSTNYMHHNGRNGFKLVDATDCITNSNEFAHNGYGTAATKPEYKYGIFLEDERYNSAQYSPAIRNTFTGNYFHDNALGGINMEVLGNAVGSYWSSTEFLEGTVVQNNIFEGGASVWGINVDNDYGDDGTPDGFGPIATVDAESNWWDSYCGPYHATLNPLGEGSAVSDDVDFEPWCDSTFTICHFTTDPPDTVWVDDDYTVSGANDGHFWCYDAFDNIMDAITAVADYGTVHVAVGIYHNDIIAGYWSGGSWIYTNRIDKSITLLGAQADVDPAGSANERSGGESVLTRSDGLPYSITAPYAVINGFMNGSSSSNTGGRFIIGDDADSVEIKYCIIKNTPSTSSGHGICIYPGTEDASISYNTIANTAWEGIRNDGNALISYNTIKDIPSNKGIMFGGSSSGSISNNTISNTFYEGIAAFASASITSNEISGCYHGIQIRGNTTTYTVDSNYIHDNQYHGIEIPNYSGEVVAGATITNNTITNNPYCGVKAGGNTDGSGYHINNNTFIGNGIYGVESFTTADVDAEYNWWGSYCGPYHPTLNPNGEGNAVSDNVDFEPWCDSTFTICHFTTDPPDTVWVDDSYTVSGANDGHFWCFDAFDNIQDGVDIVADSGVVMVAAGTYSEQVVINKSITMVGTGDPVVEPPSGTMRILSSYTIEESGNTFEPIIFAYGGTDDGFGNISGTGTITVTITGFDIDGNNSGTVNHFSGMLLRNCVASTISYNDLYELLYSSGLPQTAGILVYGNSDILVDNNTINDWTRVGIGIIGDAGILTDPSAVISNNVVVGEGPLPSGNWAQNGIQISDNAFGSITGNEVSDIAYIPTDWSASGINLGYTAPGITLIGNNIHDCEGALNAYYINNLVIRNNTFNQNDFQFILGGNTITVDSNAFTNNEMSLYLGDPVNVTVTGNDFTGNDYSIIADGIADNLYFTGNNIITSTVTAFYFADYYGEPTNVVIYGNNISNNAMGVVNTTANMTDAIGNWWGDESGPALAVLLANQGSTKYSRPPQMFGSNGLQRAKSNSDSEFINENDRRNSSPSINSNGTGNAVTANVDYSPWWGENYVGNSHTLPWTWFVDTSNNSTIQEGIDYAADGDAVTLTSDTFTGTINIVSRTNITVIGLNQATSIYEPTVTQSWAIPGYPQYDSRQAAIRVFDSHEIKFANMTIDLGQAKGNNVIGILYWNSEGEISDNDIKDNCLPDLTGGYYEITSYFRAPDYDESNRADLLIRDNTFTETGRVGIVTHDFVHAVIIHNVFDQVIDDFGYAVEMGSRSTGIISNNIIRNYDTPALSDGSASAGLYIENAFTGGLGPLVKDVTIANNEIYGCQYGMWIGNDYDGFAGDVDINVIAQLNIIHDNTDGGFFVVDEDRSAGSSVTLDFSDNDINNNGNAGIYFHTNGDGEIHATFSNERIVDNSLGIYIDDTAPGTSTSLYEIAINNSSIARNSAYGINNTVTSFVVDAEENNWGSNTGPFHPIPPAPCPATGLSNPDAIGDQVSNYVDYEPWNTSWCEYVPGDINGDGHTLGGDVTYFVNYFRTIGDPPPDSCWNDSTGEWLYSAADVNGNCRIDGGDLTALVNYFRRILEEPLWCPQTPPGDPILIINEPGDVPVENSMPIYNSRSNSRIDIDFSTSNRIENKTSSLYY